MLSAAIPMAAIDAKCPLGTGPAMPRSATPRASNTAAAASAAPASATGSAAASRASRAGRDRKLRSRSLKDPRALKSAGCCQLEPARASPAPSRFSPKYPSGLQSGAHLAHDGGVVVFAQIVAVLVYLVPVVLVAILAARRERGLGDFAVLVPAAVAVDLLLVLLLCRVVRLEWAAFISRGLWLAGGALWFDRRQRRHGLRPARPAALDGRAIAGIAMAMLAAAALSAVLSRPNAIWDRELHIPFVASLRGQQMPFASPYEPGVAFHYHFSGDVLASMLQIFSFDVLNASLALSLAHDVMFALIGLATALALLASGPKPAHVVVLSVVAVLLSGPCVLRFGVGEPYLGYSYYALYIWGFRPPPARRDVDVRRHRGGAARAQPEIRAGGALDPRQRRPRRDGRPAGGHRRDVGRDDRPLPRDRLAVRSGAARAHAAGAGCCCSARCCWRSSPPTWCSPRRWHRAGRCRSCRSSRPGRPACSSRRCPCRRARAWWRWWPTRCPYGRSCWRSCSSARAAGRMGRARAAA